MPTFAYNALDHSSKVITGEVVAVDQVAALDQIAARGLTPLGVVEGGSAAPWWNRDIKFLTPSTLRPRELLAFFSALSAMLAAKIPLPRALRFCTDLTNDRAMKAKLQKAIDAVEDGMPLADALVGDDRAFPERLTAMIRLGEASNTLGPVVARTAKMLEAEAQLRRELQQALIYPIILLVMSLFVLGVLVFYLAPTLAPVFDSANAAPPGIVAAMLGLNRALSTDGPILLILAVFVIGAIYSLRAPIRRCLQTLAELLPGTRRYFIKRESLRFCQTLSLMLGSGAQLTDAVKVATDGATHPKWQAMLRKAHQDIEAGQTMATALLNSPLIDPMTRTILTTGEESDQLLAVLEPAVATLQTQTSQTLAQLVKLLTPLLTLLIGLAVGAIILSTISAIMDLNDVVL